MAEKLQRRGVLWLIGVALFAAGFLNDPPWKWFSPEQRFVSYGEHFRVAMNLYHGGGFANPFWSLPTGPTAIVPPAYPYSQFVLLSLFGNGSGGWLAVRTFATACLSLQFALLPWIARSFGFSVWTGVLAALFGLLVKLPREELSDSHFAGLAMLLLAWAMTQSRVRTAVIAGFAFLVQPVAAIVYFPWAARSHRRWMLVAVALLVCAPWLVRVWSATGGPAWIRSGLGLELYVSFNDCAPYGIRESERLSCFYALHPNIQGAEAAKVRDMGEYRYGQMRLRDALGWIGGHPKRTASLVAQRFWYFWFPSDTGWDGYFTQRKRFATLHLLTILSFVGLWRMWRDHMKSAHLLTLWMAMYPLIYYVVQFETRYRFPTLWMTFLLAAYGLGAAGRATIKDSPHVAF
ncbi:MAG: hypothetical protein WDO18_18300 [Acidobacteriota bacterium]